MLDQDQLVPLRERVYDYDVVARNRWLATDGWQPYLDGWFAGVQSASFDQFVFGPCAELLRAIEDRNASFSFHFGPVRTGSLRNEFLLVGLGDREIALSIFYALAKWYKSLPSHNSQVLMAGELSFRQGHALVQIRNLL